MVHTRSLTVVAALLLLAVLPLSLAHNHESNAGEPIGMGAPEVSHLDHSTETVSAANMSSSTTSPQSFFALHEFGSLMLAHIVLMTIAWFFILPIGGRIFGTPIAEWLADKDVLQV